jgi:hypothetical protein
MMHKRHYILFASAGNDDMIILMVVVVVVMITANASQKDTRVFTRVSMAFSRVITKQTAVSSV